MKNILFTPGPVMIPKEILKEGAKQMPYFRTEDFSKLTLKIIKGLQKVFKTKGKVVILTSSGTGAMEAAAVNFFDNRDRILILKGGTFGKRWEDICRLHKLKYDCFNVSTGKNPDYLKLEKLLKNKKYTALFINANETSTGYLFDIEYLGKLAKKYRMLFVVDAISTILADEYEMDKWNVDISILSSQKGLALPPGLSFIAVNKRAVKKLNRMKPKTFYFNIKDYLKNLERGQMPFTPAISLMLMLYKRLEMINKAGIKNIIKQTAQRAEYFRNNIKDLPLSIFPERQSNAITCLKVSKDYNAIDIVKRLEKKYEYYVTPNPKPLGEKIFRVSHMGAQTIKDLDKLIKAMGEIMRSGK